MSEAVSRAMRMLSEEPLTEGVPVHCAADGIFLPYTSCEDFPTVPRGMDVVACGLTCTTYCSETKEMCEVALGGNDTDLLEGGTGTR